MTATIIDTGLTVTVRASILKAALATLKDAMLPTHSAGHAVLGTVRIATNGRTVTATTTNLDFTMTVTLDGATGNFGVVCLPYKTLVKLLADITKKNDCTVTISSLDKGGAVPLVSGEATVAVGDSEATLPIHLTSDWPKLPGELGGPESFSPAGSHLINLGMLTEVAKAVSTDDTRPILCAVLIHNDSVSGTATIVATDSYRLHAVINLPLIEGLPKETAGNGYSSNAGLLIQSAVVKILTKTKAATALMQWNDSGRTARFTVGNLVLTSRPIEGQFPNYKNIIPNGHEGFAIDDPVAFVAAMKYLDRFGEVHPVRVTADDSGLVLKMVVHPGDSGAGTFTRKVAGGLTGNGFSGEVAFNATLAQDTLADFTEPVVFATMDNAKPSVAVAAHPDGGHRLRLQMPVRV